MAGSSIPISISSPTSTPNGTSSGTSTEPRSPTTPRAETDSALLYLDIDAHNPWQTDEYRAKAILQELFPFGYFRASRRGQNGYLKIRYGTVKEFNGLADRLEQILQRYFLSRGILCDFETKGTITDDKSGSLAKLPFADQRIRAI